MYRINYTVLYSDGAMYEFSVRALFSDLTMALGRLSQIVDVQNNLVNAGECKSFTATIERVVETVDNK